MQNQLEQIVNQQFCNEFPYIFVEVNMQEKYLPIWLQEWLQSARVRALIRDNEQMTSFDLQ